MSQIGKRKVSLHRRFIEGMAVGVGIAIGLVLTQLLALSGYMAATSYLGQ